MAVIWCGEDTDEIRLFQGPARIEFEGPWVPGVGLCYPSFKEALDAITFQTFNLFPVPAWIDYQETDGFRLNLHGNWTAPGVSPYFFDSFRKALVFVLTSTNGPGSAEQPEYIFDTQNQQIGLSAISWADGSGGGEGTQRFSITYVKSGDWEPDFLTVDDFTGGAPIDLQSWMLDNQTALNGGVEFSDEDATARVIYGCGGDDEPSCAGAFGVQPAPITADDFAAEPPEEQEPNCLTHWAQCWCIRRRDGESYRFTSHDQPVEFRGATYQPCNSLAASAAELGSLLGAPGNAELAGIIADEAINEADLYAGLFDRAVIEVWLVPWNDEASNCIPLTPLIRGVTGNLSQGDEGFSMEVLTPGAQLQQQPLLETYTPGCRYELGDFRCGVDLEALIETGFVTQIAIADITSRAQHRVFWDEAIEEDAGYFDLGVLTWMTGPNEGHVSEVKSFSADGRFVLWRPMPNPIEEGDQYEVVPGCDKSSETCKEKFDNFENYGGFPHVPGRDSIMQTPNSKG